MRALPLHIIEGSHFTLSTPLQAAEERKIIYTGSSTGVIMFMKHMSMNWISEI
jgi:hypothetical protein